MLNKVKLTNFQRHRDLEVSFSGGLTALRGSNEAGKSTLLKGICYGMFGSKALNESLDETVTWGEPVSTLKVELDLSIDNVLYSIKRGKSGAEINYDGGMVTGQNEVTAFICRLLKVDAGAASRLMLSNQNEIRGALESGPKATTELIEKLAEFDQLDNLIELMQEKLALGSVAGVEAALTSAQEQLDGARALAIAPDTVDVEARITAANARNVQAEADVVKAHSNETAAQEAHSTAREIIVKQQGVIRDAARSAGNVRDLATKLALLKKTPEPADYREKADSLKLKIQQSGKAEDTALAHAVVSKYFKRAEGALYQGTAESLKSELSSGVSLESPANAEVVRLDGEIKLFKQSLTHGSCTFCGKDFSGVPEVAEKNSAVQKDLDNALAAQAAAVGSLKALCSANESLRSIEMSSRPALSALRTYGEYAELADDSLPPTLKWVGPDITAQGAGVSDLKQELAELNTSQRAFEDAQLQATAVEQLLDTARAEDGRLQDELASMKVETIGASQDALDAARATSASAQSARRQAEASVREAEASLRDAKDTYERAKKAVVQAQAAVATRTLELKTLSFNNALLKKVRAARPLIADKLWALVLSAVSSYFSEIRGVKSKVSKASDGFKVDGHPVTTLSGSTLDALGLAIRVALVRTFLPTAPFLILDEPGAAMDTDRTANMLGFLASSEFRQVLLVSHSNMPEEVADHIQVLGGN